MLPVRSNAYQSQRFCCKNVSRYRIGPNRVLPRAPPRFQHKVTSWPPCATGRTATAPSTMTSRKMMDCISAQRAEDRPHLAHFDFLNKVPLVLGGDTQKFWASTTTK